MWAILPSLYFKLKESLSIYLSIYKMYFLQIPPEFDIDSDASNDHTQTPEYAKDIFDYLKRREVSNSTPICFFFYTSISVLETEPALLAKCARTHTELVSLVSGVLNRINKEDFC